MQSGPAAESIRANGKAWRHLVKSKASLAGSKVKASDRRKAKLETQNIE